MFDLYEEMDLISHVNEVAAYLEEKLDGFVEKYDCIKERRGKGLMQGLEFSVPVKDIINKAMENGMIIISAGTNVLRFLPPLTITKENVDEMVEILEKSIS